MKALFKNNCFRPLMFSLKNGESIRFCTKFNEGFIRSIDESLVSEELEIAVTKGLLSKEIETEFPVLKTRIKKVKPESTNNDKEVSTI